MKSLSKLLRLLKIYRIFIKYRLNEIFLTLPLPKKIRNIVNILLLGLKKDSRPRGERLREALTDLGPIYVKFGQIISTRIDLIPDDIANELAKLQDSVPPFSSSEVERILTRNYGEELNTVFKEIDLRPLASASIAQVHAATTFNDEDVVIKVIRPNIKNLIKLDLSVLRSLAFRAQHYSHTAKMMRVVELVDELEKTILNELDMLIEAGNASQLRRNFENSDLLYVPKVYWDLTSKEVFVMERLYGIPISATEVMQDKGVDFKKLSEKGVEIFFTQVFRDRFFHADMHPGNIWVDISNPKNPKYLSLDFGIIGTLDSQDQNFLAQTLLAFFNRDYKSIASNLINTGWVAHEVRVDDFEVAIRAVCEPIFAKPLSEISFGKTLFSLFDTAKAFDIQMQPQLLLLQKTLVNVEGLGRRLYPDLDLWETGKPLLEQWMKDQAAPSKFVSKLRKLAPYWISKAPELPELIYDALQKAPMKQPVKTNIQHSKRSLLPYLFVISSLSLLVGYNMQNIDWKSILLTLVPSLIIGSILGNLLTSKDGLVSG